ncbi:MAG: biopolymer transporter ExbD [Deltaproteobacteria bacterium]|nr:biopolymer transporter ExbD [Deltaproteobacteria bacterium]
MPIVAPSRRINPTVKRKGNVRKQVYAGLFLTSMVDMFAILVIFLLQSFSAEGDLIILPPGLELPKAENVGTLEPAPSLVISQDKILFEGVEVAKTAEVMAQTDWAVPKLQEALKNYQPKTPFKPEETPKEEVGSGSGNKTPTQKINISADRRMPFSIVKKIIYNAGYAGFPDFRFAVFAGPKVEEAAPKK